MLSYIKAISQLLTLRERMATYGCFCIMLLTACIEVIGVSSIMPFIAVLSDPGAISRNPRLATLYQTLHFTSYHRFLMFLGSIVLALLVTSNLLTIVTTKIIVTFTYARQHSLSKRLFSHYLYQPYAFFLEHNPATLSNTVLSEIGIFIQRTLISLMDLLAKLSIVLFIVMLLLLIDPILTCLMGLFLGGAYTIINRYIKQRTIYLSEKLLALNASKAKIVADAFHNIKNVKLLGKEPCFIETFSLVSKQLVDYEATGVYFSRIPRYLLEMILFSGTLLMLLYLILMGKNVNNAIPLLGLYSFAFVRLIPAIQVISMSSTQLWLNRAGCLALIDDLQHSSPLPVPSVMLPVPFHKTIELRQLSFYYPHTTRPLIRNLNLTIQANTTVGLVGTTGAGKTTLVNLILGLLLPTKGNILIDGTPLTREHILYWQKKMGYVSQDIVLLDDTVTHNIAFGLAPSEIDQQAVIQAARIANIHQVIDCDLPQGYETIIGHNGIQLSGGQRQRLSIARALYHQPDVLVLDEATSALDVLTEEVILDSISQLAHQKTIIVVAHRLTTLMACDVIHVLQQGQIVSSGNYHQLIQDCPQFKAMADVYA